MNLLMNMQTIFSIGPNKRTLDQKSNKFNYFSYKNIYLQYIISKKVSIINKNVNKYVFLKFLVIVTRYFLLTYLTYFTNPIINH